MSKKPARSDRDADLPDWADDITPSDEVMKKFYAPTGAFKAGPIIVPRPESTGAETSAERVETAEEEPRKTLTATEPEPAGDPAEHSPETPHPIKVIDNNKEVTTATSLSPAAAENRDHPPEKSAPPPSAVTRQIEPVVSAIFSFPAEAPSFEDFARRWKRYLYPGQLAVMRILFELTIARNTNECFTRYSELAAATKMSRRNCINVMNSLVERGFVQRLEVRNDASGKGIRLRVYAEPLT